MIFLDHWQIFQHLNMGTLVADAEDAAERVRFLISEDRQYGEVVKIIQNLLLETAQFDRT